MNNLKSHWSSDAGAQRFTERMLYSAVMRFKQPLTQHRRWWEVRAILWAALLVVCSTAVLISSLPEMRSSLRVTVAEPVTAAVHGVSRWPGWPALGFASVAGVLTLPLVRRMGIRRSVNPLG